jgi:molecular chaperone HtpG
MKPMNGWSWFRHPSLMKGGLVEYLEEKNQGDCQEALEFIGYPIQLVVEKEVEKDVEAFTPPLLLPLKKPKRIPTSQRLEEVDEETEEASHNQKKIKENGQENEELNKVSLYSSLNNLLYFIDRNSLLGLVTLKTSPLNMLPSTTLPTTGKSIYTLISEGQLNSALLFIPKNAPFSDMFEEERRRETNIKLLSVVFTG